MTTTIILIGKSQREYAMRCIAEANNGSIVKISDPTRTDAQNRRFWAMLGDLSAQRPEGREHTADTWKLLVMHACGFECQFQMGLNGHPFPTGFRSSRLTVAQMNDLMTWMEVYGAEHGVIWSEPGERAA